MAFELKDVNFTYPEGTVGLVDISLSIGESERIAVLGSNGSGKSTLLRILNGLLFPDSGEVRFNGTTVTEQELLKAQSRFEFRSKVGFVFQDADAQLFNSTVFDEVMFGPSQLGLSTDEVEMRVNDTLQYLGIDHMRERAPFRLSGGEKRKVAIASVLSMNPEVLLMDEPIAGLDPKMQAWLVRTLNDLQRLGKTTIVATHDLRALPKIADRVLVISEDHTLLADCSVDEVLSNKRLLVEANVMSEDELEHATL